MPPDAPSRFEYGGRAHLYQLPDARGPAPRGTVVFLHDAARDTEGFWLPSAKAPRCTGLGEDVSRARQALARGYAFVAPAAVDATGWSFGNSDHVHLAAILSALLAQHRLLHKPVYLCGCGAGGALAARLPSYLRTRVDVHWRVAGVVVECAAWQAPDATPGCPPTLWVVMQRAAHTHAAAARHMALLRKNGVPAAMAIVRARAVTAGYFADRIPGFTEGMSAVVASALEHVGVVDERGAFRVDPRATLAVWTAHLKRLIPAAGVPGLLSFEPRRSPLLQAIFAAYAEHEHAADYMTAALAWFESRCTKDFGALAEELAVRACV